MKLIWIDLEMTGLNPRRDQIIEVGAIVTDADLNEQARWQASIAHGQDELKGLMASSFWQAHADTRDNLIASCSNADAVPLADAETKLLEMIGDTNQPIYLAGNSVYNDLGFIKQHWPTFARRLHYRLLDVSSWKIIFEARGDKFQKAEQHRALSDIEESIAELKHYINKVDF